MSDGLRPASRTRFLSFRLASTESKALSGRPCKSPCLNSGRPGLSRQCASLGDALGRVNSSGQTAAQGAVLPGGGGLALPGT